ncbi:MAG TPA: Gfo/Idh/MocA family oxidoreductase [Caulifigura sp.]|nr:Gfo/Idh/MocA family oxidoreductase [Caulifigura sp.]
MAAKQIRIGIIGAGANTRLRHIPGFRAIPNVEIVGVVNRTPQSTARVAQEFGIPQQFSDWRQLIECQDIDAVLIGAWPNLHCGATVAALEAGKHVLCEARMARNLGEARQMLAASEAHPDLVAQIVPSPYGLVCGPIVTQLLQSHYLGTLREVIVLGADDQFWDYSKPLHWRQDEKISGKNVLSLGILHETLMRWVPPVKRVFAQGTVVEETRPVPDESRMAKCTIPDNLQIVAQYENNIRGIYHMSGVTMFGPGKQIHLYGSRGTIRIYFGDRERVMIGHSGEEAMHEPAMPLELLGRWRVEEEFIGAIRGTEKVKLNDFATALKSMEFTEAVALSRAEDRPVSFPL